MNNAENLPGCYGYQDISCHLFSVKLCLLKLLDDFPDTVGFARIVQALQATEWPSLQMKGKVIVEF